MMDRWQQLASAGTYAPGADPIGEEVRRYRRQLHAEHGASWTVAQYDEAYRAKHVGGGGPRPLPPGDGGAGAGAARSGRGRAGQA